MASIAPGIYTFNEVFGLADFDFATEALTSTEDNEYVDHRRVQVGGLSFDDPDQIFRVPESADEVEITLDGAAVATLTVDK
jgi:hypothetical protein